MYIVSELRAAELSSLFVGFGAATGALGWLCLAMLRRSSELGKLHAKKKV